MHLPIALDRSGIEEIEANLPVPTMQSSKVIMEGHVGFQSGQTETVASTTFEGSLKSVEVAGLKFTSPCRPLLLLQATNFVRKA